MRLSVYLQVAVKSFQRHLAYRAANLAGIVTNTFFGAIYIFVYVALFQTRGQLGGLDLRDTITYAVITQSLLMAMSAFGNRELSEAIMKGEIVRDISRPVDFYLFWAAIDLGRALYYLLFRGVPTFLIGWLLFRPRLPGDGLIWLLFLVSLASGMVLSFAFRFITNSLAFWTTDARGINYLTNTIIMFFSGFIVPLNFFPASLRAAVEWLPFRGLAHLPVNVYLGKVSGAALIQALALQAAWLVLLVLVGRFVLSRVVRRLTIHGG
jgi:ABC-2 type transport system permease protein